MLHCHAATSHSFNDFTDNIVLPSFNHDVEIAVVSIIYTRTKIVFSWFFSCLVKCSVCGITIITAQWRDICQ
jgi:hypothetical protein